MAFIYGVLYSQLSHHVCTRTLFGGFLCHKKKELGKSLPSLALSLLFWLFGDQTKSLWLLCTLALALVLRFNDALTWAKDLLYPQIVLKLLLAHTGHQACKSLDKISLFDNRCESR